MNVFYEEDGTFKAASVLAEQGGAFQVEAATGKRSKVKAAQVLIEFKEPAPQALLREAGPLAEQMDLDFLWECAPQEEFDFDALAKEYFGPAPTAVQRAALVMRLHGAPMYFYRKGRGRFRPAPADALKAALASVERKRHQALLQAGYVAELTAGRLPEALRQELPGLLFKPDKTSVEFRALDEACAVLGTTPTRLLLKLQGFASARALHEARFLQQHFPHGTGFPPVAPAAAAQSLPSADVAAFSIDDHMTTEIDDALSVVAIDGGWRIGIHIAAPGLAIRPHDPVDVIARERYSTVYFPGAKITMLPDSIIDAFSLKAGHAVPALSLYVEIDALDHAVRHTETRVERVPIAYNLRHNELDGVVTEAALETGGGDYPCKMELGVLWRFALTLHAGRQAARVAAGLRPEAHNRPDFNFYLDGETVSITPRRRDAPVDRIVAELMILANSSWGKLLAERHTAGIYRVQQGFGPAGRVRMVGHAAPHQGLGVAQYAWSTSPLRRYVDLVNQWQIMALVLERPAPLQHNDAELFAIISGFDAAYAAYAEFQATMERYWCLRWLEQEGVRVVEAVVLREDWVSLEAIPLQFRVPALPPLPRGTRIEVELLGIDEVELQLACRCVAIIEEIEEADADVAALGTEEASPE